MGLLFSRFRTKPSTKELLEDLQKEIEALEEYKQSTELQQKVLVRNLVVYSVLLYIIVACVIFFYSYPVTTKERLVYSVPFLIFPILLYILKKFLQWYFVQKLRNNEDNLMELKKRKKSLLDFAMETETYKVVKELLEKYDPAYHRKVFETRPAIEAATPLNTPLRGSFADMELRRRSVSPRGSPPTSVASTTPAMTTNNAPGSPNVYPVFSGQPFTNPPYPPPPFFQRGGQRFVRPPMQPMPRPVLPRERTLMDRLLDYLVGDGPSNRYALICRQCQSHNGMALKEEYEYVAFRCCYCFQFNPPRNTQPPPPRLTLPAPPAIAAPPPSEASPSSPDHSSSDETEHDNASSDADVSSANAPEKTEENTDNTESSPHRLSISSDVSEIQANLVEDTPFPPSNSTDTEVHDEESNRESS